MHNLSDRLIREREAFDHLAVERSSTRGLLDRFSQGFYDKGRYGRLWGPFWRATNLRGALVLDYGCGSGSFSQVLAGFGASVYGIDISPQSIMKARAIASTMGMNGSTPQFFVCDAHHTPFKDGEFDYVVGNGALHHLDLDQAYAEIARVLKPGGKAVFMEPMYHHPLLWLLRKLTPDSHTVDERPLSLADIEKAKKWFRTCCHREHFLFSVCAAPAHVFGNRFALSLIDKLDRFDQQVMRAVPAFRRFAWLSMLEMEK